MNADHVENEHVTEPAKNEERPRYRSRPPKLPPGATFTPTHLTEKDETTGKWMNRRKVAQNLGHDRRARKELGLSPRQLKRLRREERVASEMARLEADARAELQETRS